jgi:hypothetical protein
LGFRKSPKAISKDGLYQARRPAAITAGRLA